MVLQRAKDCLVLCIEGAYAPVEEMRLSEDRAEEKLRISDSPPSEETPLRSTSSAGKSSRPSAVSPPGKHPALPSRPSKREGYAQRQALPVLQPPRPAFRGTAAVSPPAPREPASTAAHLAHVSRQPGSQQPAQHNAPAAPRRPLRSGAPRPARTAPANERRSRAEPPAPLSERARRPLAAAAAARERHRGPEGRGGRGGFPPVPRSRERAPAAASWAQRTWRRPWGEALSSSAAVTSGGTAAFPEGPAQAALAPLWGGAPRRKERVTEGGSWGVAGDGVGRPVGAGSGPSNRTCWRSAENANQCVRIGSNGQSWAARSAARHGFFITEELSKS